MASGGLGGSDNWNLQVRAARQCWLLKARGTSVTVWQAEEVHSKSVSSWRRSEQSTGSDWLSVLLRLTTPGGGRIYAWIEFILAGSWPMP
jgi:hypothetical protein